MGESTAPHPGPEMTGTWAGGRRHSLVLDVDTGVDDALALALACAADAAGAAELLAVTCVAGNAALPDVTANTRELLRCCGRDTVPVAAGAAHELIPRSRGAHVVGAHGGRGRGYARLARLDGPSDPRPAAQLIVEVARARPGQVTLVSTGPMTNVALALALEPELPRLLRRWVLMGGAYAGVRGNTTPAAEFNVHADPDAAHAALTGFAAAPRRPLAVGLDVTHRVRLLPHHLEELGRRAGATLDVRPGPRSWGSPSNPLLSYLVGALRAYAEYHQDQHGFYGVYLHDAVAVAVALDPGLVTCAPVAVAVERQGVVTTGQTVADWQEVTGLPANLEVAVDVDPGRVVATVLHALESVTGAGAR